MARGRGQGGQNVATVASIGAVPTNGPVGDGTTAIAYQGGTKVVPTAKAAGFTALLSVSEYSLTGQMTPGSPCVIDNTLPEGTEWTMLDYTNAAGTLPHRFTLAGAGAFKQGAGVSTATFDLAYNSVTFKVISGGNVMVL